MTTYSLCKKELAEFQKNKIQRKLMKAKYDLMEKGDSGTKAFHKRFSENRKQTYIDKLKNKQDNFTISKEELLQTVKTFYSELFQATPSDPEKTKTFSNETTRVLEPKDDAIIKPITETELLFTIKQMALGKTPGPDGIGLEFYRKYWNIIAKDFTQVINDIHSSGNIPDEMKTGIITLIYKNNDKKDLKNYRPISLLNTDLKIYTKCIANRLKLHLIDVFSKVFTE